MDLDELLFGTVSKFFKKRNKEKIQQSTTAVFLNDIKPRLTILARAITGNPVDIFPAEREGGYKNTNFFLPIYFNEFSDKTHNLSYYFFRVLFLATQAELNINYVDNEDFSESLKQIILNELFKKYTNSIEIFENLIEQYSSKKSSKQPADFSYIYGKLMKNDVPVISENKLQNFDSSVKKSIDDQPITTLKAKAVEEIISLEIDKKQKEDYVMLHNFEKVETAEEFNGNWRDFDGSDEIAKHENAIEDLSMKYTVRVDDTAHSVYQSDFIENTSVSESVEMDTTGCFLKYDEWDFERFQYKQNFCRVYPKTQLKSNPNYYHKTIKNNATLLNNLRKTLANLNNKMQEQKRQTQGYDFDIDALTDLFVDVHSKKTPSDNIYLSNRKKEKDLSILVLLDSSLSTDSYTAGKRVIDIEKEVSILFGEILNEFSINFSIDCFYSKTRNYSTYITLKEFGENWNIAKNKIGAIEPIGYTRIGTALRHAGAKINSQTSKNKWIILISDGKPNDYDKYEGKYGINDVKQALRELNQKNINSYALAIEAQAKYYLPLLFGQNHYQVLPNVSDLLQATVKLFDKIKRS